MRVVAACLLLLAGCAEISGLNGLEVCEGGACVDATAEAAVDATADAPGDAPMPGDDANADAPGPIGDGGIIGDEASLPCDKPATCPTGDVCCDTAHLSGSSPPCQVDSMASACAAPSACPTTYPLQCTTAKLRRCTGDTDCAEANYNKCCTIPYGPDASVHACANTEIASLTNGSCP